MENQGISILNFYDNYELNEIMCYSTVYNFIIKNVKMLEKQEIIKINNKRKIRKNYIILRPVKLRVLIRDYFFGDDLPEVIRKELFD